MSPILVRPVREQLEHDRVIRLLQAKYKRKFEVAINPGTAQTMPVGAAAAPWYPDLVLQSPDRPHAIVGLVEVETAESVNHLEAMSQWGGLSKLNVPFYLYVPATSVDSARRLAADHQVALAELWLYQTLGEQIRFTLVQRMSVAGEAAMPERDPDEGVGPVAADGAKANGKGSRPPRAASRPTRQKVVAQAKAKAPARGKTPAIRKRVSASKVAVRKRPVKVAATRAGASAPKGRKGASARGPARGPARKSTPSAKAHKRK